MAALPPDPGTEPDGGRAGSPARAPDAPPRGARRPAGKHFLHFWLPVILCMGAISAASSIPSSDIPGLFAFQDVSFHGIIYALLGMLFFRALRASGPRLRLAALAAATLFFGLAYGVIDEFHQSFVPGRCSTIADVLTDGAGALAGAVLGRIWFYVQG